MYNCNIFANILLMCVSANIHHNITAGMYIFCFVIHVTHSLRRIIDDSYLTELNSRFKPLSRQLHITPVCLSYYRIKPGKTAIKLTRRQGINLYFCVILYHQVLKVLQKCLKYHVTYFRRVYNLSFKTEHYLQSGIQSVSRDFQNYTSVIQ